MPIMACARGARRRRRAGVAAAPSRTSDAHVQVRSARLYSPPRCLATSLPACVLCPARKARFFRCRVAKLPLLHSLSLARGSDMAARRGASELAILKEAEDEATRIVAAARDGACGRRARDPPPSLSRAGFRSTSQPRSSFARRAQGAHARGGRRGGSRG